MRNRVYKTKCFVKKSNEWVYRGVHTKTILQLNPEFDGSLWSCQVFGSLIESTVRVPRYARNHKRLYKFQLKTGGIYRFYPKETTTVIKLKNYEIRETWGEIGTDGQSCHITMYDVYNKKSGTSSLYVAKSLEDLLNKYFSINECIEITD